MMDRRNVVERSIKAGKIVCICFKIPLFEKNYPNYASGMQYNFPDYARERVPCHAAGEIFLPPLCPLLPSAAPQPITIAKQVL
jgi:hypothetical protein